MKPIQPGKIIGVLDYRNLADCIISMVDSIYNNKEILEKLNKYDEIKYIAIFGVKSKSVPPNNELIDAIEEKIKNKWYFIDRIDFVSDVHVIYNLIDIDKENLQARLLVIWHDALNEKLYLFIEPVDLKREKQILEKIFNKVSIH